MKTETDLTLIKKYLERLLHVEEHLRFKRGQVIYYAGHRPYGLYMLRKGRVGLKDVKESFTAEAAPGEIFGEEYLTDEKPYEVTAVAMEDSTVSFFPKSVLTDLLQKTKTDRRQRAVR